MGHLFANAAFKGSRSAGKFSSNVAPQLREKGKLTLMQRLKDTIGKRFNNQQSKQVEEGIIRGLAGKPAGLKQKLTETWLAPEFMAGQHLGAAIGQGLKKVPAGERSSRLAKLRASLVKDPQFLKDMPGGSHIAGGLGRIAERSRAAERLGNVPVHLDPLTAAMLKGKKARMPVGPSADSNAAMANNLLVASLGVPAALVKPSALAHAAVNRGRIMAAHSSVGRKVSESQLAEGIARATGSPKYTGKARQRLNSATDYLVSPAVRDPSRMSEAYINLQARNPAAAKSLAKASSPFTGTQGGEYAAALSGLAAPKSATIGSKLQDKAVQQAARNKMKKELAVGGDASNAKNREAVRRLAPIFRDSPNPNLKRLSGEAMDALPPTRTQRFSMAAQDMAKNVKNKSIQMNPWGKTS
jgi:hypothetical protein